MNTDNNQLLRVLTLKDAVGVGLGAIIGAGIFVVTGVAAGISGPAFLIGLFIAGNIATCNALSSAQLAAAYPFAGGTYDYGNRLLKPVFGFIAGWMFLISKLAAGSVVAIGFGSYFYQLIPIGTPEIIAIAAIVLLCIANLFGIKKTGNLNLCIVGFTILVLIYLIFSGVPKIEKVNFTPFAPFGITGIAEATALLFFAFTGYARIATLAEEVKNPKVTIPKAIIITIVTAIILYGFVSVVAIGVIGTEAMAGSTSPLQVVAEKLTTPGIQTFVALGACTAMLGVLLSQILGISRMFFAMARNKDFFPPFQKISERFKVPTIAILSTGGIIMLIVIFGAFEFVLASAAFSILLYYSITNIAALRQPVVDRLYAKGIPVLGLIGCLLMAFSLHWKVIISGIALLIIGLLFRFLLHRVLAKTNTPQN
ncbi:MAG: amino acid permease [Flavobacteriales bacterium]|nr:amino acid permease [Flavobacteriales bacterium]